MGSFGWAASQTMRRFVIQATMQQMMMVRPISTVSYFVLAVAATRAGLPHYRAPGAGADLSESARVAMDDSALVRRVAGGDHDAFAALYDKHGALVFGVAKRVLRNQEQAEDVAQSVFLQVWSRPQAFAGGNFAAWIARVARNASVDILRSAAVRKREPEIPVDLPAEGALEEQVFERMRSAALSDAVATLPDDQRVAIEQAYFAGLSYREVAEALDAPLGTVKSRIRTGLRRLFESLNQA